MIPWVPTVRQRNPNERIARTNPDAIRCRTQYPKSERAGQSRATKDAPELIEYAYSLKGKQVRVPQKVLKDIADSTSESSRG